MGQRLQAAGGCLVAVAGAGAGLAVWFARAQGRWHEFEAGPNWSLLYAELPFFVIGGTAAAMAVWAVADRLRARR
ncbi:hypothetical protein AB0D57_09305 [Streptomyces sp. NPDC048275]|uniref:hypothetical protein n=1 Tax=Streptomyces sp. NPDC048275 TaxID=3155629 RepID=UPI00340A23D8